VDVSALVHHRSFRAPVAEIWPWLTRSDQLAGWLGAVDLDLTPGGAVALQAWNGDAAAGHVVSVAPPVRLEMAWRPFDLSEESRVSWRLEGDGPGSRLTVAHDNLRSPEERSAAKRWWREALEALHQAVDGGAPSPEWGATIPIAIRASLSRPAAEIWPLMATPGGIEKWIAHVDRFEPAPGGAFRFTSRYQGHEVVEEGQVEEITAESRVRLSWEWAGQGWGGRTKLELSLDAKGPGSALLLVHSAFEEIAVDKSADARRYYATSWPGVLRDLMRLLSPIPAR
jgi:uncharacterized protein YndB with AHSA1/START domain